MMIDRLRENGPINECIINVDVDALTAIGCANLQFRRFRLFCQRNYFLLVVDVATDGPDEG